MESCPLCYAYVIYVQCLVFYLQQEGLELGEKPPPLNVSSLTEDWSSYQTWCSQLSSESIAGFLRAGELGTALGEEVVVENAAVYLWNYHLHWVKSGQLTEVVGAFKPLLASMKQIKMSRCIHIQCIYVLKPYCISIHAYMLFMCTFYMLTSILIDTL